MVRTKGVAWDVHNGQILLFDSKTLVLIFGVLWLLCAFSILNSTLIRYGFPHVEFLDLRGQESASRINIFIWKYLIPIIGPVAFGTIIWLAFRQLKRLFDPLPDLVISSKGIEDRWNRLSLVPWSEIDFFAIEYTMKGKRKVGIYLMLKESVGSIKIPSGRRLVPLPSSRVYRTFVSADDLLGLIALFQPQLTPPSSRDKRVSIAEKYKLPAEVLSR